MFAFSTHRVLTSMNIIEMMKRLINQHGIPCIRRHTSQKKAHYLKIPWITNHTTC